MKNKVLCVIPARGGSKRIPNKNIKMFCGKPLIAHTILQAKKCNLFDRVIVDTDSTMIADISKRYGAEVPFLRPSHLAEDRSKVIDALIHLLDRLEQNEDYRPTHIVILQTTSPLRELADIHNCWDLMKESKPTTVVTVCETQPMLFHVDDKQDITLANDLKVKIKNPKWCSAHKLNGMVYIVSVPTLRRERSIITRNTKAVVCPVWRSVDVDLMEHFVMAEVLFKEKSKIATRLGNK